jgi:molybdopterin-guanine dinucleotide biosynthesis protein A
MTRTNSVPGFALTGGVLAGGLGTRLGGTDKGWIEVAGQTLIRRVLDRLQPQVETLIVNANRRCADYARFGWPVVCDATADFPGPLAGISAVLDAACTDWVLFVPIDAARLPDDLAPRLCESVRQNGSSAAFASTADGPMPVCSLIARALRDDLRTSLTSGERSVLSWLRSQNAASVLYENWPREYWSINTPAELTLCEQRLGMFG